MPLKLPGAGVTVLVIATGFSGLEAVGVTVEVIFR
jgi:hypothetical protein